MSEKVYEQTTFSAQLVAVGSGDTHSKTEVYESGSWSVHQDFPNVLGCDQVQVFV